MDDRAHILVVDDDRRIRELLKSYLTDNGFRVTVAESAAAARQRMRGLAFDLMVLDIMMPGESGLALTQALRGNEAAVPILMLSALSDTDNKIDGLTAGSDDYLAKPFEPRELLLRIRNLLRRAAPAGSEEESDVRFGGFNFNLPRGELRRGGELIKLTSREKELLRLLARHPGQPIARSELTAPGAPDSARNIDVQINRLRRKIETDPANPAHLQTIRGSGYALYLD
jgi:two-component system, OmpR family, phosphate regulon response regulator OmpR